MGVIQRFKDIMSANINAMLDKAENPEKMIDQYMRNLEDDLGKVKAETASVMAEEARAKRAYDEALAEVEKYQKYAEKAVAAGNDNDARVFLQSKKTAQSKLEGLKLTYDTAAANAQKMRQMHDKLVNDISDLRARKETIKAKVAVAKAHLCRFHFALVKIPLLYLIELAQDLFLRALHILYFHAALHQHNPLHAVVGRAAIIAQAQLFTHI